MDIAITIGGQISKVAAQVTAKDGVIRRTCKLTVAREFDVALAQALGTDAKKTLTLLEVGSLAEATIPIDGILARAELVSMGQRCTIRELRGVVAKAKAGDADEGTPATVKLEFECDWAEEPWVFLGRHLSCMAEIDLASVQTEMKLPGDGEPRNRRGKGARA